MKIFLGENMNFVPTGLINIVQVSYMNEVSHTSFHLNQVSYIIHMNMRVPFLNRIWVRCLESSSFYFRCSNNKGLTRKSKNRIKENSGIEGQITDFFSYTFLEVMKKSHTKNHKIRNKSLAKSAKITNH